MGIGLLLLWRVLGIEGEEKEGELPRCSGLIFTWLHMFCDVNSEITCPVHRGQEGYKLSAGKYYAMSGDLLYKFTTYLMSILFRSFVFLGDWTLLFYL